MGCTKRVSWHHRSLPCVIQKNIRTLDATHTHTHTRTTRPQRPQFGVSLHILKLPSSDLRHVLGLTPSRKQKDAESERSNLLHIFNLQQSAIPGCTSKVSSKVRRGTDAPTFHINRGYLLHTLTPSRIQTNDSRKQKDAESEQHKHTLFPERFIPSYRGPDPEGDKSGRGSEASASPARALVVILLDLCR